MGNPTTLPHMVGKVVTLFADVVYIVGMTNSEIGEDY